MRSMLRVGVPLAFVAAAAAQTPPVNLFHVYTDRTSFTSRGFLAGNAGETLQGYPVARYRGVGDTGQVPKVCLVHGFGMITQDQDRTTVESFAIVFRSAALDGTPDGSTAGVIARTGQFDLPTAPGSGPVAWIININLGKAGVSVPCNATYYAGLALSPNPLWTSDGQSTHASAYTDPASAAGDPVRDGAENHAYQVDEFGAVRANNPRSWNYNLQTQRGAFQVGCLQAAAGPGLYGNCGNYPDVRTQGLAFRFRDAASAGALGAVFLSDSLTGGAPIAFDGLLWISPGIISLFDMGTLSPAGTLELMPAATAPGALEALFGMGHLAFQGVILDVGTGRFNVRTMDAQSTSL